MASRARDGRYRTSSCRTGAGGLRSQAAASLSLPRADGAPLFFERPLAETSSPRNALIGRAVAIGAGAFSLGAFGLLDAPSVLVENVTPARIGAGALSVALTGAVLLLLNSSHPPTGATTLIVSLGFLHTPPEMAALMVGVIILTVVGWLVNRMAGVHVPLWSSRE